MSHVVPTSRSGERGGSSAPGTPLPLTFTIVLSVVLVGVTVFGLLVDGAYRVSPGVRQDLAQTMRGQDLLTLLSVPVLVWTARRALAGSLAAHLVWLGLLLYYAYSFVIYAFAPFNDAFLGYTLIIAMSGYGFLNGLVRLEMRTTATALADVPGHGLGIFLLVVAGLFLVIWLAMIVPAIPGGLPAGRVTYDIASPVHVLDLSVMLPLVAGTGWMLLRRHPAGAALGVVLLCKILTLGLAMLFMSVAFVDVGNPGELALWVAVIAVAGTMLVTTLRRVSTPVGPWLRRSFWC